jgi:CRP-like cAMP-binding protein
MVECSPFDIFQWLPTNVQEAFSASARRIRLPDGERIYTQAEPGNEMFRILSGSVRMSVLRHDGREALYLIFEPGDCFGTSSLVDGEPRPQTASAQGEVELQILRRDAFERLRSDHPAFSDALLRLISRHMRLLSDYFVTSNLDELPYRVAKRLLEVFKSFGVRAERGIRLSMRLSQAELALMVGASRQSVSKVLQAFQEDGLIAIEYGSVLILDLVRLQLMVSER